MKKLVFLLEEASMKAFLDEFIPRLKPGLDFLCIPHEGKQDLERSIPRKLKAWRRKDTAFVVLRDNDNAGDCRAIKKRLQDLCAAAGRSDVLVRIVCQELEAWHLGAIETLAEVYGKPPLTKLLGKSKYSDPDSLGNAAEEIVKILPEFTKTDGARRMGSSMSTDASKNRSKSFQALVYGIEKTIA
jgi:hypothetical protein